MKFKPMARDVLAKLLEDSKDTLTEPLNEELDKIRGMSCPNCGSAMVPEPKIDSGENVFKAGTHIPIYYASCGSCGTSVDPETSLVIRTPR